MKTVISFTITLIISTFAMFGALAAPNPFPCFGIAFGIWAIFIWSYNRRSKREAEKRFHEHMFNEYMRSKTRQHGRGW